MKALALRRLRPASTVEDRRDFASTFNASLDAIGIGPGDEFAVAHPSALEHRLPRVGECQECGKAIDPNADYRRETGYARRRGSGGTNALALREAHEGDWVCARCIDRLKRGIAPTQGSLAV